MWECQASKDVHHTVPHISASVRVSTLCLEWPGLAKFSLQNRRNIFGLSVGAIQLHQNLKLQDFAFILAKLSNFMVYVD